MVFVYKSSFFQSHLSQTFSTSSLTHFMTFLSVRSVKYTVSNVLVVPWLRTPSRVYLVLPLESWYL